MTDSNKRHTEIVGCDLCGAAQYSQYDRLEGWLIVRCRSCGFCYTNPRPTIDSLPSYYEEEYFSDERHAGKFYYDSGIPRRESVESFNNRIEDIEQWFTERGTLLELGSARGFFLDTMRKRGWDVKGVEISEDAAGFARSELGLDVSTGVLTKGLFPESSFDVVCMYQTLEHVPNPSEVVRLSSSLLKPGGVLIAEVPNLRSWDLKGNPERKRLSYDLPRHLNHFTESVLKKLYEKHNLQVVDVNRYHADFILKMLEKRSTSASASTRNTSVKSPGLEDRGTSVEVGLARRSSGWKVSLLNQIAQLFPGWRITVTGRKRN